MIAASIDRQTIGNSNPIHVFSSRRRHTRCLSDWSSDVCSSDLERVTVVLTGEGSDETLAGYTRYAWTLLNSKMDRTYRALTPAFLRRMLRTAVGKAPLSASVHRKLEHTFLMRDGEDWPSFYFDNFYSAFSASEFPELLTPGALVAAGQAYAGSMGAWERSHGDLLHRLLYTDIN